MFVSHVFRVKREARQKHITLAVQERQKVSELFMRHILT